jgi:glutamate dehydrogenase
VAILRAYRKYRQRIGSRFTEGYQNDVLVANSPITAKLVRYFELRFDPEREPDEAAERDLRDEILADLEDVSSIHHDRILRNQLGAIDATLRTSAYKEGRGATAFKLRSARRFTGRLTILPTQEILSESGCTQPSHGRRTRG